MPVGERKLPIRDSGNVNEAFVIKTDREIGYDDNQWPDETAIPGFRAATERYARTVEALARRLLPIYAVALDVAPDFFDAGFTHPFWRLRMTHYPPVGERIDGRGTDPGDSDLGDSDLGDNNLHDNNLHDNDLHDNDLHDNRREAGLGDYGIPPHVDTTFFTLLLQDSPGLTIYSTPRDAWVNADVIDGAYVVNTGELLRQWTNDRFLSVRHFANNGRDTSRYSIPFFFNANADYPMQCIPTCCGPDNPPRYPPVSYLESQAVVQGE
jgi:isopenicillin N synthase-like dioxygenase